MGVIRRHRTVLEPPPVAILNENGSVYVRAPGAQRSRRAQLDSLPKGCRTFASWETAEQLLARGKGEALSWTGRPIRWRAQRHPEEESWKARPSDVNVLRLAFPDDDGDALRGLAAWRDWLGAHNARPTGSLGGSAMCLLRSTVPVDVWTMRGDAPPLTTTMGARQHLAVDPGTSVSPAWHVDLPAAYPTVMGNLRFGAGIWRQLDASELARIELGKRAELGPLLIEARVTIPELPVGPLPERPTLEVAPDSWERCEVLGGEAVARYPVGCELEGIWCWPELREAARAGCELTPLRGWWLANNGGRPFLPWLAAVRRGRELEHPFARLLAKSCANSAWGTLVVSQGQRALVWVDKGSRRRRLLPVPAGEEKRQLWRSMDVAELVCGTVRAELARMMRKTGPDLLSAHTDGGWTRAGVELPDGWVRKIEAARVDILGAQTLRYWRPGGRSKAGPLYVVAGSPPRQAEHDFEAAWSTRPRPLVCHRCGARVKRSLLSHTCEEVER